MNASQKVASQEVIDDMVRHRLELIETGVVVAVDEGAQTVTFRVEGGRTDIHSRFIDGRRLVIRSDGSVCRFMRWLHPRSKKPDLRTPKEGDKVAFRRPRSLDRATEWGYTDPPKRP